MHHTIHPNKKTILKTIKRAVPNPREGTHDSDSGGRPARGFPALALVIAARRTAAAVAYAKSNTARLAALGAGPIPGATERKASTDLDTGVITRAVRTVYHQASKPGNPYASWSSSAHWRYVP